MVSALVSGSSGPGSSPGRGHCDVFLGKTLYSHSAWTGLASDPGGVEIPPVALCYRNRDKLRPDGPPSSYADFTLPLFGSKFTFSYFFLVELETDATTQCHYDKLTF